MELLQAAPQSVSGQELPLLLVMPGGELEWQWYRESTPGLCVPLVEWESEEQHCPRILVQIRELGAEAVRLGGDCALQGLRPGTPKT